MAVILPDWLKPADPLRGAEEGASLGLQQRGQNISAGENAARLAQSAQEAGAAHQMQQQQFAASMAEQKARLDLETQTAARKFQAQQGYQQAIQQGVDPKDALLQFGPLMGIPATGYGAITGQQFKQDQAMIPPQFINDPDTGRPTAITVNGQTHVLPQPRAAAKVPDSLTKRQQDQVSHLEKLQAATDDQDEKAEYEDKIQKILDPKDDLVAQVNQGPKPTREQSMASDKPQMYIGPAGGAGTLAPMTGGQISYPQPQSTATGSTAPVPNPDDPLGLFTK